MPAERSRGSRRTEADGAQLVWTMPVEPKGPSDIAFAPNVTPVTFTDDLPPPGLIDFDSTDALSRRSSHGKKKPENHIPRPPNAFILFRSHFIKSQHVSTDVETNHSTLSKIIGLTWQNLQEGDRKVWHDKAKEALEEHKRKFPDYAFRPTHSRAKGGGPKRKVREVEPKDMKRCAKIAELLVEGKKGHELNAAIQEFDKHHVPEIVTRFEAPITEQAFRRPSSTPPEAEDSRASPGFLDGESQRSNLKPCRRTLRKTASLNIPETKPALAPSADTSPIDVSMASTWQATESPALTLDFSDFSFDQFTAVQLSSESMNIPSPSASVYGEPTEPTSACLTPVSDYSFDYWTQGSSPVSDYAPITPLDQYLPFPQVDASPQVGYNYDPSMSLPSFDEMMVGSTVDQESYGMPFHKTYPMSPMTLNRNPCATQLSPIDTGLAAFNFMNTLYSSA